MWTHTAIGRFCKAVFAGITVFELFDFPGLYGYYVVNDFGDLVVVCPNDAAIQ